MKRIVILIFALLLSLSGCDGDNSPSLASTRNVSARPDANRPPSGGQVTSQDEQGASRIVVRHSARMIYVIVALCDNKYQGIVPVSASLGDGDNPRSNLYWGAAFGVKTFFGKSKDWKLVSTLTNPSPNVLERCVFKHRGEDVYLVADAYRGREIRQSIVDFLKAASGDASATVEVDSRKLSLANGASEHLVVFVGHNGLMDFSLDAYPQKQNDTPHDAIILSCASKGYFAEPLRRTGAQPLLWTTGLMAPESYILKAAVDGWMRGESGESVRQRAAIAYNTYQKCGLRPAQRLFASGW